jgi:hypothetical protein
MHRSFIVLFAFSLATAASAQSSTRADAPERAADPRDKIVCKRFVKTGSLVDGYRTCKTKWEWERERENLRQLNPIDSCRDRGNGGAGCG